jgi:signal transduction histidine kinase
MKEERILLRHKLFNHYKALTRRKYFTGLIFLILLIKYIPSHAQTIILSSDKRFDIKGQMAYYEDLDSLAIDEVVNKAFHHLDSDVIPNLGFNSHTHWFRITIKNNTHINPWYVEVAYPILDELILYQFDKLSNRWTEKISGDLIPLEQQEVKHRHPVFVENFPFDTTVVLYLRLRTYSSIQVPVYITPELTFYKLTYEQQFINGLFYGLLIIMLFYHILLYSITRDLITLYYIFTVFSGIVVLSYFHGYGYFYLYPDNPKLNLFITVFAGPSFVLFSGLLTRAFLNIPFFSKILDTILKVDIGLNAANAVLTSFFPTHISFGNIPLLSVIHSQVILICVIYGVYRKYRPARYFLLSWASLLVSLAVFSSKTLGYIPSNKWTNFSLYISGILQPLLLAFALGDRLNFLTKENEAVKDQALKHKTWEKEKLDMEVRKRTELLTESLKELRETQQQLIQIEKISSLGNLVSGISHEINNPLNFIIGGADALEKSLHDYFHGSLNHPPQQTPEYDKYILQENFLPLIQSVRLGAKRIGTIIGRLSAFLTVHQYTDTPVLINDIIEESLTTHRSKLVNIELKKSFTKHEVWINAILLQEIFSNIIDNATDAMGSSGTLDIIMKEEQDYVSITFSDNGCGIAQAELLRVYDPFYTTKETGKGTGLGLYVTAVIINNIRGRINITSKVQQGTNVEVKLPLHKNR